MASEVSSIITAIIVLTIVSGFYFAYPSEHQDFNLVALSFLFSIIIIFIHVFSKKLMAFMLDSDVTHEIWSWSRYGLVPHHYLKTPIPLGIIFPLIISLFTLGLFKFPTILTYEARALKAKAAKRFGFYSFSAVTEWENGLIGAAGIVSLLILSMVLYFLPSNFEYFAKITIFYALFNLVPISKLDGTQIFFGSRVLWISISIIALVFTFFALTQL